jgi:hypothetical protein
MEQDPIVEEIHAIRAQIAEECGFDLQKIVARLQEKQLAHKDRLIQKVPSMTTGA